MNQLLKIYWLQKESTTENILTTEESTTENILATEESTSFETAKSTANYNPGSLELVTEKNEQYDDAF